MKIVAGHKYIKGPSGDIIPYSAAMLKAAGDTYKIFIPDKDIVSEHQLPENEAIRPASHARAKQVLEAKKPVLLGEPKPKLDHQDITAEMKQDLSELK